MNSTTEKKLITPTQLKALQTIFSRMGMSKDDRHDFVSQYTEGRTTSSRDLTMSEAIQLLKSFDARSREVNQAETRKLLSAIYHLSFKISFLNQGFSSETEEDKQMNYAKINRFTRTRSKCRKAVNEMNLIELRDTKKQFEALAGKE